MIDLAVVPRVPLPGGGVAGALVSWVPAGPSADSGVVADRDVGEVAGADLDELIDWCTWERRAGSPERVDDVAARRQRHTKPAGAVGADADRRHAVSGGANEERRREGSGCAAGLRWNPLDGTDRSSLDAACDARTRRLRVRRAARAQRDDQTDKPQNPPHHPMLPAGAGHDSVTREARRGLEADRLALGPLRLDLAQLRH